MNKLNIKNNRLSSTAGQVQMAALLLLAVLFTSVSTRAQSKSVTIKLPTTDNTSDFKITDNAATPATLFKLSGDGSLLSKGTYVSGTTAPSLGAGTRMWWYPKKGAFRVGYAGSNVGNYSFASGYNTTASGTASTAMGESTTASGNYSTAMGSTVSTNSHSGSFIIGDNSTTATTHSTAANQMMMRFAGGYVFYTDAGATKGAILAANQSS
jgi:hypothetical protein